MNGTQTIFTNLTIEQMSELIRGAIRSELSTYIPPVPKPISLPEYPSRQQTRDFLGVSFTTLNQWAKDTPDKPAVLVPFKVGNRGVRYRRDDVMAALKEYRRFDADRDGQDRPA